MTSFSIRACWPVFLSLTKYFANWIARTYPLFFRSLSSRGPSDHLPQRKVYRYGRLTSGFRVEWHIQEGEAFTPVKHCATVRGPIRKILLGERVALNTLARCSGIATK